jgi:DNA-binding FadR family transcriptional regulator
MSVAPPDPAFFMDLLDVRMIVEPNAARLAAARASPAQIAAIEAAYKGMERSSPHDMEACCKHDLALHELIITATGNAMLINLPRRFARRCSRASGSRVSGANAATSIHLASIGRSWLP